MGIIEKVNSYEPSKKALLFANLLTIALAVVFRWGIFTTLWICWAQALAIGIITVFKIVSGWGAAVRHNVTYLKTKPPSPIIVIIGALAFCLGFSLFYGLFLLFMGFVLAIGFPVVDWTGAIIGGVLFFLNHLYSFFYHDVLNRNEAQLVRKSRSWFTDPLIRIAPIFILSVLFPFLVLSLTSVFFETSLVVIFLLLKTHFDLKAHDTQHAQENKEGRV